MRERDPLTGLLNRSGFETYLSEKVRRGNGAHLAVLYIDLDRFKPVNDTYGHAAGDEVLCEFGMRLQCLVRASDAVARLGGDEFGVVLSDVSRPEEAALIADKVVAMAARPIRLAAGEVQIGASVGIAFDAQREGGWKSLVARADSMAYKAKSAGRGRPELAPSPRPPGAALAALNLKSA